MKILVIDNGSRLTPRILRELSSHEVSVLNYSHDSLIDDSDQDMIVLTGSSVYQARKWHEGKHWFRAEIDFISHTNKPVIAICLGFQLLCMAYNTKPRRFSDKVIGLETISLTETGKSYFGESELTVYQNHIWGISELDQTNFDVLAYSTHGIEAIKHRSRPIIGTQFHPEFTNLLPALVEKTIVPKVL